MKSVLVTGGAGFIGSHVAEASLARGDAVWIVDDLSSGRLGNVPEGAEFVEMDICATELHQLFEREKFDLVYHHAAQIDVRSSVADPMNDARINTIGLLNLTEACIASGTRRFINVSSGGVVYGEPEQRPTPELAPKDPRSPYGVSKLGGEYYLNYYRKERGLEYVALRYSNVYGPRQDPHGEAGVVAIFSHRLLSGEPLTIFGDGEQTRDYVYVKDVVAANMLASDAELGEQDGLEGLDQRAFNVGTGVGTSVNQLASVLEGISGNAQPRNHEQARAGELRHSTLDSSLIRSRGWAPGYTLASTSSQSTSFVHPSPSWSKSLDPSQSESTPSYQVSGAPGCTESSPSSSQESWLTDTVTWPFSVNFTALLIRLVRIWRTRTGSPLTWSDSPASTFTFSARPLDSAWARGISAISWTRLVRLKSVRSRLSLPASILEKSRMSLMMDKRASPDRWMVSAWRCC